MGNIKTDLSHGNMTSTNSEGMKDINSLTSTPSVGNQKAGGKASTTLGADAKVNQQGMVGLNKKTSTSSYGDPNSTGGKATTDGGSGSTVNSDGMCDPNKMKAGFTSKK